ncbi:MAG: AsmA family protein [Variovorax sp.]|nr:MAG: AsmA family protein [Variovorax sp.]
MKKSTDPADGAKRSAWRIFAIALGAVVLLLAAGYVALRQAYPPERLAAMLAEQVTAATGRALRINGKLSIRLLPTLAVQARDVSLANADWGSQPDMARLRRVAFEVSLRDLFDGEIRILSVDVEGADVWLESDGAGRFNWQFGARKSADGKTARPITFDRFVATDSRVTYHDVRTGTLHTVAVESLDLAGPIDHKKMAAAIEFGQRRWKLDGETGPLAILLAGVADWPFALRLTTDGATVSASGTVGTGPRAGIIEAKMGARIESSAVLTPLIATSAAVPMPLEASGTLRRKAGEVRLDPMQLSVAGQPLSGQVTLHTGGPQLRVDAAFSAAQIDLAKWGIGKATASPPATPKSRALFGDTPLPFDALPAFPLRLALKVERLNMPGAPALSALDLRLASERGRIAIDPLSFAVAGGQVGAKINIALPEGTAPRADVSLSAKSLSVEALDALQGGGKHFDGGRATLEAKLAMTGRTPRSLAATSAGEVTLTASNVALSGKAASLDRNVVMRLLEALLLPVRAPREDLVVQCAVVRLPLRNGVAAIDRSIAVETPQMAVAARGEVNLAKQTVALAFRPTAKKGLDLKSGRLLQLILLKGPLEAPEVSVDPRGVVREAADVGVVAATGGISLLFPALRRGAGEASVCAQATRSEKK